MREQGIDVSIIVPVYNCENYLETCILSILKQTHNNIEVILVNDGSSDRSGEICDFFNENHENIIIVHQKNRGVSSARNAGLKIAKGKYITFIDADDYIEECYIKELFMLITSGNYDFVASGGRFFNQFESYCVNTLEESHNNLLCSLLYSGTGGVVWGKLVKSSIIKKNNILFNEKYSFREDLLFWIELSKYIEKHLYVKYFGYNYRISTEFSSLSTKYNNNEFNKQIFLIEYIEQVLNKQNVPKEKVSNIINKNITSLVTETIIKLTRSGNSSYINIRKIITNESFNKYNQNIKINSLKDILFNAPIKFKMVYITYRLYIFRCYFLAYKERIKVKNLTE